MSDGDSLNVRQDPNERSKKEHGATTQELIAVSLLSVTTILTAWSAFDSAIGKVRCPSLSAMHRAQGSMPRSCQRRENQLQAAHLQIWTEWLSARGAGEEELAKFINDRFSEPLTTAHKDWIASNPQKFGKDVTTPFGMPSYVTADREKAAAANVKADATFEEALQNNQRGDDYTLPTVLFASLLFSTAMSGRVKDPRSGWLLLAFGLALSSVGVTFLATFPKLV